MAILVLLFDFRGRSQYFGICRVSKLQTDSFGCLFRSLLILAIWFVEFSTVDRNSARRICHAIGALLVFDFGRYKFGTCYVSSLPFDLYLQFVSIFEKGYSDI